MDVVTRISVSVRGGDSDHAHTLLGHNVLKLQNRQWRQPGCTIRQPALQSNCSTCRQIPGEATGEDADLCRGGRWRWAAAARRRSTRGRSLRWPAHCSLHRRPHRHPHRPTCPRPTHCRSRLQTLPAVAPALGQTHQYACGSQLTLAKRASSIQTVTDLEEICEAWYACPCFQKRLQKPQSPCWPRPRPRPRPPHRFTVASAEGC